MTPPVHRPGADRFEATVDGHAGHLEYDVHEGVLTTVHTEVDPALEGRGVAGALVQAALDHARANGLEVRARCAYAASYIARHPEAMSPRA